MQIVPRLRREPTDLPLGWIVTPEETHRVKRVARGPDGIDCERLDASDLDAMPVLRSLRETLSKKGRGS